MAYVFLFQSAKNRIYEQNIHTYTLSGAENSPFQFWLTIEKNSSLRSISGKLLKSQRLVSLLESFRSEFTANL